MKKPLKTAEFIPPSADAVEPQMGAGWHIQVHIHAGFGAPHSLDQIKGVFYPLLQVEVCSVQD